MLDCFEYMRRMEEETFVKRNLQRRRRDELKELLMGSVLSEREEILLARDGEACGRGGV